MHAALAILALAAPAAGLNLHSSGNGSCSCLTWTDVYAHHGVKCGQGFELGVAGERAVMGAAKYLPWTGDGQSFYDEFCTRMYQRIAFDSCFNKKFGATAESWCYVPGGCGGAVPVEGTDVAVHTCTQADKLMDATPPPALNRLAMENKLEVGLLGKLSYPMESAKWSEVEAAAGLSQEALGKTHTMESYYGIKWSGPKAATPSAKAGLGAVRASGVATIFDTDNGHGGGTLVLGAKTYTFLPMKGEGSPMGYVCVGGC